MAWYKFSKKFESLMWCYVEADSFEKAREQALRCDWEESELNCVGAWVAKAPDEDEGEVPDPDAYDFDDWFSNDHRLNDTRSLTPYEDDNIDE